jgi:pilus assembly protein CpaC
MHPFQHARRLLLGGLVAAAGLNGLPGKATAQPPAANQPTARAPDVRVGKSGELLVPLGGIVRFTPKLPAGKFIKEAVVGNDQIVQARPDPTDPGSLQLIGVNPGVVELTLTLNDDTRARFEIVVQPDYDLLRRVIQRAVPTASVDVIPGVGNAIILSGYVNKPEDAATVVRIAEAAATATGGAAGQQQAANVINAIQVGGVQHVQIEVVVAQVNRTELRERGADFTVNGTTVQFSSLISGLITNTTGTIGGSVTSTVSPTANLQLGIAPAGFLAALRALRQEGLAKFLSEPKVVTQSGRPAFIRSGGQQAVLSATGGGLGSISVSLEQVGTQMEVIPIVMGSGKIYLEVFPQVRTRNDALGISTSAGFSPGFTEQSTRATVMLESGQTFAIGGLLETTTQAVANKVPVLGDLPFVGPGFSNVRYDQRETELVIMVTPRLVDALDCSQTPKRMPGQETRAPDDYELYLEGLLEAPRGQRQVWNGKCYQAAYKCDPTYGTFPCRGNVCGGGAGGACPPASATGVLTGRPLPGMPAALPPVATPAPAAAAPVTATGGTEAAPPTLAVPTTPAPVEQASPTGEPLALPVAIPAAPGGQ